MGASHCAYDVKLRILRRLPFLEDLADTDIEKLGGSFHDVGYAPGAPVYRAGEPASRLFVVAAGKVKLVRTGSGGQNLLIDMLGEGDHFGSLERLGEELYSDTAIAHVQSCVLVVSAEGFHAILSRFPSVSLRLVGILAERLREAHEKLEMLHGLSVEGRIAFVLLRLGARFGEQQRIGTLLQLPLSREELGEMAGTTTESASRVISRFSREGLVRTGRRWVALVDTERLSAILESPDVI
jgi:CRP-like cAMP-binding protein